LKDNTMSGALAAGFWGLVAGSALVLGATITYVVAVPPRVVATVMAFGSGVLISALSFDLMQEAFEGGGFDATRSWLSRGGGGLPGDQRLHLATGHPLPQTIWGSAAERQ